MNMKSCVKKFSNESLTRKGGSNYTMKFETREERKGLLFTGPSIDLISTKTLFPPARAYIWLVIMQVNRVIRV